MRVKVVLISFFCSGLNACLPDIINPVSQKMEVDFTDQQQILLLKKPGQGNIHNISVNLNGSKPDSATLYHSGNLIHPFHVLKESNLFSTSGDRYSDSCFVVIHAHSNPEGKLKIKYTFNL